MFGTEKMGSRRRRRTLENVPVGYFPPKELPGTENMGSGRRRKLENVPVVYFSSQRTAWD